MRMLLRLVVDSYTDRQGDSLSGKKLQLYERERERERERESLVMN